MTRPPGLLAVAIGLLLVVLEVPGFGVDFANDIVGYAVVAWAAWMVCPGERWSLVGILAACAAAVSVFGYGGPASHVMVFTDQVWTLLVVTETAVGGSVFAAVLWALAGGATASRRTRALVAGAAVLVVAAAGRAVILPLDGGLAGTSGAVAEACGVVDALLRGLTVALTLTFSHKR